MKNWTNPSIAAVLSACAKYACVAGLGVLIGILLLFTTGSAKLFLAVGIVPLVVVLWALGSWFSDAFAWSRATDG